MGKHLLIGILGVIVLAFGCVPRQSLTRSNWLQMTTREFRKTTVNEVLIVAEKVMRLSDDSSDIKIYHTPNKMVASRHYNFYAVLVAGFGQYNFDVTAVQAGDNVKVQVFIGHSSQGVTPMMTYTPGMQGGTGVTATTTPVNIGMPVESKEAYQLFFLRMKAILEGGQWYSCDEAVKLFFPEEWKKQEEELQEDKTDVETEKNHLGLVITKLDPLCFNADDERPVPAK